jgi:hypothetical protein
MKKRGTVPLMYTAMHFQHSDPEYTNDMGTNIWNGPMIITIYPDQHLLSFFSVIKYLGHASVTLSRMSYSRAIKPCIHVSVFPLVTASNFLAWLKHSSDRTHIKSVSWQECRSRHGGASKSVSIRLSKFTKCDNISDVLSSSVLSPYRPALLFLC